MGSQLECFVVFCRKFKRTECYTKRKHVYLYMYRVYEKKRFIEKNMAYCKKYGLLKKKSG